MIDYDKLKLAHELADNYYEKTGASVTVEYNQCFGCYVNHNFILYINCAPEIFDSIDDLIAKLQELTNFNHKRTLSMTVKITPATESEKMVLGALLLDGPLINVVKDMLCPADFTDERRQKIFAGMKDLFTKHGCFDIAMLVDELAIPEHEFYLLVESCISTRNIESHACIIREKSVQRQLVQVAQEIAEGAIQ